MNRLIGIAGAILFALVLIVPVTLAASPTQRGERFVIVNGSDMTLPADQSVEVLIVSNGHARIEGDAAAIFVVNGTVDLVGAHANGVVAISSEVHLDGASVVSGDVRLYGSTVVGASPATVTGAVRQVGPDMLLNWPNIGTILFWIYIAFVVSALMAGVLLAAVAGRQVRAASALITNEPAMVVGAAFLGVLGLLMLGILALVTIVGIPFGIGVLAILFPAMLIVGYIVAGTWVGEMILGQSSPRVARERPILAAAVGLAAVGLISIIPGVGGLVSFVGFGAVFLLTWRAARGIPAGSASSVSGAPRGADATG
jgi:hypothetical protein